MSGRVGRRRARRGRSRPADGFISAEWGSTWVEVTAAATSPYQVMRRAAAARQIAARSSSFASSHSDSLSPNLEVDLCTATDYGERSGFLLVKAPGAPAAPNHGGVNEAGPAVVTTSTPHWRTAVSVWDQFDVTGKILAILEESPIRAPGHHFGRPWLTAYQITTALEARHPETYAALAGPDSAHQRVARQLSERIKNDPDFPIEGADLSTVRIHTLMFERVGGEPVPSSVSGGRPLSMFRSRAT